MAIGSWRLVEHGPGVGVQLIEHVGGIAEEVHHAPGVLQPDVAVRGVDRSRDDVDHGAGLRVQLDDRAGRHGHVRREQPVRRGQREGLPVTLRHHLADDVVTGRTPGDDVGAVGAGDGAEFARVEGAVVVGVHVDRDAGHAGLSGVADAVAVAVLELDAAQFAQDVLVAEVQPGDDLGRVEHHLVGGITAGQAAQRERREVVVSVWASVPARL